MRRSSGILVLAVACIAFAGLSFVGPAREAIPREARVAQNFFNEPPKPKKVKLDDSQFQGPFWGFIKGVDAYTKKGSASLGGPLAGVPWMTIIYLLFFFWITNLFITEGAKPPPVRGE